MQNTQEILNEMRKNYQLASAELKQHPTHLSSHWKKMNNSFNQYLQDQKMWPDFRRNAISQGMDDSNPHDNMIIPDDMGLHLEALHLELTKALPSEISCFQEEVQIGNPVTHNCKGKNISNSSLDFAYFAWRIVTQISNLRMAPLLFVEIGGGFGGLTRVLKNLFPNSKFILFDLPEGNVISTYFLKNQFPNSKFFYLNNLRSDESIDWSIYDFAILPGWCSETLADQIVDYVINTRSMQEMRKETIADYFFEIQRIIKSGGLFYCVNRYNKKIGDENIILAEYPYDEKWDFVFSSPKYSQNHIHELISRRTNVAAANFPHPELTKLPL